MTIIRSVEPKPSADKHGLGRQPEQGRLSEDKRRFNDHESDAFWCLMLRCMYLLRPYVLDCIRRAHMWWYKKESGPRSRADGVQPGPSLPNVTRLAAVATLVFEHVTLITNESSAVRHS